MMNSYIELDINHQYYGWFFIQLSDSRLVSVCKLSEQSLEVCQNVLRSDKHKPTDEVRPDIKAAENPIEIRNDSDGCKPKKSRWWWWW